MGTNERLVVRLESTDFSGDRLDVYRLTGREAISQLFSFDVDVACRVEENLPEGAAPGARVALVFERDGLEVRRVQGLIAALRDRMEPLRGRAAYRMRVVPRAFLLTLVETQEIFLGLSVPQILEQKLALYGFTPQDLDLRLLQDYPAREFVVQYKESDLALLCRLAEHLGVSFCFEEGGSRGRLVFTDHRAGFRPIEGAEQARFRGRGERRDVFSLELDSRIIPGSFSVQDYNYRHPQMDLTATHTLESGFAGGVIEYGAHVKTPEEASQIARVRAEEREAQREIFEGRSTLCQLRAGGTTTIVGHPRADALELLIVEVEHEGRWPLFDDAPEDAELHYTNSFKAISAEKTYRPPRRTPRPRIHGVVTGIVQPLPGADVGAVARLDEHGRYVVQIHFDTAPPGGQKASHAVRMAQPYAGPNHGMHFPLRPGAEVLLGFVDGDPDRPIILGAVPNAIAPSPVAAANANTHRISTAAGVVIEISDRH